MTLPYRKSPSRKSVLSAPVIHDPSRKTLSGRVAVVAFNATIADEFAAKVQAGIPKLKGTVQQEAIWEAMLTGRENLTVSAGAGCGKSTTLLQVCPQSTPVSTVHSLGFAAVRRTFRNVKVDKFKTSNIVEEFYGKNFPFHLRVVLERAVSLCKANLLTGTKEDLEYLEDHYDLNTNGESHRIEEMLPEVLKVSRDETSIIDFDDMIWLPLIHDLFIDKCDLLMVDEAQDLNRARQELLFRSCHRMVLVGDPNQAVYGFTGADTESMDRMSTRFRDTERGILTLPLTYTRRCPSSHVKLANSLVPDFHPLPGSPKGVIRESDLATNIAIGDMVVCRTNAPLVRTVYGLLRNDIPARIQGRDIGEGLVRLINRLRADSIPSLATKLDHYEATESARIRNSRRSESALMALNDKCECIRALSEGMTSVPLLVSRITNLFFDTTQAAGPRYVLLTSIHRGKGLEAERVWILQPELLPHPLAKMDWEKVQERNLAYVAVTRSLDTLSFVGPIPPILNSNQQE